MRSKIQKIRHWREQIFADKLTRQGKRFIYQPASFNVEGIQYRPDFYVPSDRIFYEVVGTRQAFNQNRQKIDLVRKTYPFIRILVVNPDGTSYRDGAIKKKIQPAHPGLIAFKRKSSKHPVLPSGKVLGTIVFIKKLIMENDIELRLVANDMRLSAGTVHKLLYKELDRQPTRRTVERLFEYEKKLRKRHPEDCHQEVIQK